MKRNITLSSLVLSITLFTSIIVACHKEKTTTQQSGILNGTFSKAIVQDPATEVTAFNRFVGAPLNPDTARQWMNNYLQQKGGLSFEYIVPASAFSKILSNQKITGVFLYYATDGAGHLHVIPIGGDKDGHLMKTPTVDCQQGAVSWEQARQWRKNYTGEIKAFFFGAETFVRLIQIQKAQRIRVTAALKGDGQEAILLSDADVETPQNFEDDSYQCQPKCAIVEEN